MADYKDYIVRYDIIADVTKAAEGLQSIATIAKEFEGPMTTLQRAITQVSQSVYQLKQNSQMTFAPRIDTGAFNSQLRSMVVQVRSAAAEMHAAIFEALTGNASATKAAQKGIASTLSGGTKSVATLKRDIEAYNKELDKLLGTPSKNKKGQIIRGRDGAIQLTKNAIAKGNTNMQEKLLGLESRKTMFQKLIQQSKADLAVAEKLEREAAAQQAKTAKAQSSTVVTPKSSTPQPARVTNVTPAVIREWKKAFGDARNKSLTVNIRGNATGANGALTVIEQIQASLKALQSQGTFNINPILNTEGFAAAESHLTRLAGLSAAVMAPFANQEQKTKSGKSGIVSSLTKDEKSQLANARKQVKAWNEKIAPIQQRLDANRAIPEDQRTSGIKGQITRDTKTLAAYQASRAEQENIVRNLQGKSKTAVQTATKGIKPLAIDVVGNLSKINVTAQPPTVQVVGEITRLQSKVTEAIPVNVKIMSDQVAASVRSITPPPTLNVQVHLLTDKAKEQLQALGAQSKPVAKPAPKTTATTQPATTQQPVTAVKGSSNVTKKSKGTTDIAGKVDTKGIIQQIKDIPRQTIPIAVKLMWERGAVGRQEQIKKLQGNIPPVTLNFDTTTATAKLEAFIAKVKAASPQNIKLTATGTTGGANPTGAVPTTPKATAPSVVQPQKTVSATPKKSIVSAPVKGISQPKPTTVSLTLDTSAATAALEAFIAKVKAASPQNIKLTATGVAGNATAQNVTSSTAPAAVTPATPVVPPVLTGGTTQKSSKQKGHTGHQPLTTQERYDRQKQRSEEKARKQKADNRFRATKRQEYASQHQAWYDQQQAMYNRMFNRAFGAAPKPDYGWAERAEVKRAQELATMRQDAMSAFAKPTPFEKQQVEARKSAVASSISKHQRKATRLKAQAQNAMLPFAQNKEQLNMLTKHRRYFKQAVASTGIVPTPGMEAPQMLKYLQGVSSQMQQASVAVPWQLQGQINKLEGEVAKSKGIGESAPARRSGITPMPMGHQKPFFDRARRWAYPLTGQTSFGVRTPMAVDMAKGMGVMFAIGGAMSAIGSSFSQAMEYQNTMRTTQAILQNGTDSYSQNSFKNMEATVRNVGVKTKFSAPEVASAARFLAMAGYDIDAINASIRPIADLALIGDSDLGETADKMTNIMTTFGIAPEKMRQAANIMATTATRSNTDLMMLAESAKYGGGVANMYGRKDPNLFADTMALFGVMGNAGIQASSAGTALRMMYQNIFKPNKNQRKVLDMMKDTYGISTTKEDGSYRAMSDILMEMAQRIPENQMAQIVGNLFRITAQPGAAATLMAAAGGDQGIAQEIGIGIEAMSNKMSSKAGLSSLASLMMANRNSLQGNISGAIAEEKQNTISGLWAQVTSTFTEDIVQAFENRQGGFEEILRKLRDYLAKPETIQMIQNLLDMIIEIGKTMAWFAKIWASLYNAAPGLIKTWIVLQMAITQMGTLIAPVVSLIGVFDRLKNSIAALAGMSAVSGTSMTRNVAGSAIAGTAANSAMMSAPFVVGKGQFGVKTISGNAAVRANKQILDNALLAAALAPTKADIPAAKAALDKRTRQHYAAVRERAIKMYGPARAGRAFKAAATAIPTVASFAPMIGGLKTMLMGLLTGLAKAVGFLANPVTAAIVAVTGLGYGLYKLKEHIDGNSEAQKRSRAQANKAADQTNRELAKEGKWYQDMMSENIPDATPVISSVDTDKIVKYNADKERFSQLYATIFNDFSKDASKQSVNDVATKWRNAINNNAAYSLALKGVNNYDFSKKHKQLPTSPYDDGSNLGVALWNLWHIDEDKAINQRNGMVQDALMIEGANDSRTQKAIQDIVALRQKFLNGDIKSENEYQTQAQTIRDNFMSQFTAKLPSAGMTPEQFQQTSNRGVYDSYQLGAQNLLDATISGQLGTMVGKMNAYQWLSDTKNKAKVYTDEWYNAISNIIGDYRVIYNAVSADGKQQANVELILSTLPNGQLNFTSIIEQIRAKVNDFNLTVQGFSDIIGTAYKMMAEAGVIDIKDRASLRNQILHQMVGAKFNDETPRKYYAQWIHDNPNSEWIKAGISEKQYVDFIMGRAGETLNLGNRIVSRKEERQRMWTNIAGKTADTIIEQNKHLTEQAEKLNNNAPKTTPTSPQAPAANDQMAYASPYDRAAARPTQVVFNINNLASFDRTAIASNAEERDLIAAMEDRITGAVYQIFAEASNQAQRVMDLT